MGIGKLVKSGRTWACLGTLAVAAGVFFALRSPQVTTLEQTARIVELGLLALGLLSLFLIAEQTRLTAKWNKLLSYHQFFGELITSEMVSDLRKVAETCGFSEEMRQLKPIHSASLECIVNSDEHMNTISAYLDEFEEFCAAVHAGVADHEYAYTLEATRVIRAWVVFEPFITRRRATVRYSRCYLELERLGGAWLERREKEAKDKADKDGVRPHV